MYSIQKTRVGKSQYKTILDLLKINFAKQNLKIVSCQRMNLKLDWQ